MIVFRYKKNTYPENSERLDICNDSGMEAEVMFSFQHDTQGTTYLLDPSTMTLSPGQKEVLTVYAYPTKRGQIKGSIICNIKDNPEPVTIQISCWGVRPELELDSTHLNFGKILLHKKDSRGIMMVNKTVLPLSWMLQGLETLGDEFVVPQDQGVIQPNSCCPLCVEFKARKPVVKKILRLEDLTVSPLGEMKLKSCGGSCKLQIQFSPQQHIAPFSVALQAEFKGFFHHLLTIEGCYKGFPFEVTFTPVKLSDDIRYENLFCFIDGSPLIKLTVTGSCVPPSISKEVINFTCRVRTSQTQTLSVTNPTCESCNVILVIKGEQFSAAHFMTFEPNQSKTFDITYRPLNMTTNGNKHLGSVFFSFPGGRGILFNLQGSAFAPKAEDIISQEVSAKTQSSVLLQVNNWLTRLQRFSVLLEVVKPEKPDPTVFLIGHKSIEVPALAKMDYKMSFNAYKEGEYTTKVTFHNETTGEFLFYLINFKVGSPGVLATINLETPVRKAACGVVHVENPLNRATSFTTECKCTDIKAPPQQIVPGQSKGSLNFEYLPLHVGESTIRLTLCSSDLGQFHYNLLL
ncbi:hydrocephalus-inducing protein homolog [Poecilia formosa]|uniref:hydrocephalus-inducing protein homolog n=1 Tax=Poecilia formosa TaxID=48698 RepID=UPI0007B9C7D2|nr:PREDICTED: hydrocephalus-inducing protein homolog [Poecilia formosa]